jgi:hypothetical protein
MIATADATSTFRDFILAPTVIAASLSTRERLSEHRARPAVSNYVTDIIVFRTVRHMPNGATCPNLMSLSYHI